MTAPKRIAILASNGFEQSELMDPRESLKTAGYTVDVVSPEAGSIRGWKDKDWGDTVEVDVALADADAKDYDALVLPGGVINPDKLRMDPAALDFIRAFADDDKVIAAICHAPWLLVESGIAKDRDVTSWPSVRTDLENAGGRWRDEAVVEDGNLITSRKPEDIPAFSRAVIRRVG